MQYLEIILILLAVIACLAPLADKIKVPFPVVLVTVGLLIGFVPGLPSMQLAPDLVFLIFLPPLLYEAAVGTSWHDLKKERKAITFLSVRMVFITMAVLAVVAHYCIPGFTWPLSFLLGAILSPPDAVAAMAAMKGLKIPKKWSIIIEGESLLNDASALIAYRYALLAVAGGAFVYWRAGLDFLRVTTGGVLIGFAIGFGFSKLQRRFAGNPATEISLTLLVAYVAYLFAEHLHTSGVLAVVTTGLLISWRSFRIFTFNTRLQMRIFWQVLSFLLNGFVFILIGLQLPSVQAAIGREHLPAMIGYGLLISFTAILLRPLLFISWAYIAAKPGMDIRDRLNEAIVISWSGMRGVVSLATALALPLTMSNGNAFPQRDAILFITFIVILVTLVVQGLSYPALVRSLGIDVKEDEQTSRERDLRTELIQLSIDYIDNTLSKETDAPVHSAMRKEFEERLTYLQNMHKGIEPEAPVSSKRIHLKQSLDAQVKVIQHQRQHLILMHKKGAYSDDMLHKMEQELDIWQLRVHARMQSTQLNVL